MTMFDRLSRLFAPASTPSETLPTLPGVPTPPPVAFDFEDDRLPDGARVKIRRILACLDEAAGAIQREQVPGFTRVDMEQMREIHLPKLARSYIEIPSGYRGDIFRRTGRSASFILMESLDQMQTRMDDILKNLAQSDIDAFTENVQFIGQRYGDEDNPFR